MHLNRHYLLAAPLLWLLACRGGDVPAPGPSSIVPLASTSLTLTRFRADSTAYALYSGLQAPANLVIRDAAAWSELWQNIHASVTPVPPLPSVDFSQDMIVAAALGTRTTGGYDVLLAEASEDAGSVQIRVIETSPGADCFTTQALTQPVDLARMARRDGTVSFSVTQQVRRCGA